MATFKDLFDETFYLARNADVAAAVKAGVFASGFDHYVRFGAREGRDPNILFDSSDYLLRNVDVLLAGVNPLEHYFNFGAFEGRDPGAYFDSSFYLVNNADVAGALINPLQHFITFGGKEGRDPSKGFDSSAYLAANKDVAAAGVNPLIHFLQFGMKEGRVALDTFGNPTTDPVVPDEGLIPQLFFMSGEDNLTGSANNDTALANIVVSPEGNIINTLNSADTAEFKGGDDSLTVVIGPTIVGPALGGGEYDTNGFTGPNPSLFNLENIIFKPTGFATNNGKNYQFDATRVTGLQSIKDQNPSTGLVVNNLQNLLETTVISDPLNPGANLGTFYRDSLLTGASDVVTVSLNVTNPSLANFGTVTVGPQFSANGFETVNISEEIDASLNPVTTPFTLAGILAQNANGGATGAATLNVKGAATMTAGPVGGFSTINNLLTGAAVLSLGGVTSPGAFSYNGNANADALGSVTATGSVDLVLGAGNNSAGPLTGITAGSTINVSAAGGNDTITGTVVSGSNADITIALGDGNNSVLGVSGVFTVTMDTNGGILTYTGGTGNDAVGNFDTDGGAATFTMGAGNNTLSTAGDSETNGGALTYTGGDGADTIGAGGFSMATGAGAGATGGNATLTLGGGTNALVNLSTQGGNATITGGSGNDTVTTLSVAGGLLQTGTATLTLGDGINTAQVTSDAGDVSYTGGTGVDTLTVNTGSATSAAGNVTATLGDGDNVAAINTTNGGAGGGSASTTAGTGNDNITSTTNTGSNTVNAGSGNNTATTTATNGATTVTTEGGNDTVNSTATGSGDVTINAGAGTNIVTGVVNTGALTINTAGGDDTISGTVNDPTGELIVNAGDGADSIAISTPGGDIVMNVEGGDGNDLFDVTNTTLANNDTMRGGLGTDTARVNVSNIQALGSPLDPNNIDFEVANLVGAFDGTFNMSVLPGTNTLRFLTDSGTNDVGDIINIVAPGNSITAILSDNEQPGVGGFIFSDDLTVNGTTLFSETFTLVLDDADIAGGGAGDDGGNDIAGVAGGADVLINDVEVFNIVSQDATDTVGDLDTNVIQGVVQAYNQSGNLIGWTVTGDETLELQSGPEATSIDATGLNAALIMNTAAVTNAINTGETITLLGGTGNDVLVGTNQAAVKDDIISGNNGDDALWVSTQVTAANSVQADVLTGGAGADTFVFSANTFANLLDISNGSGTNEIVRINDFVSGTDKLRLLDAADTLDNLIFSTNDLTTATTVADLWAALTPLTVAASDNVAGDLSGVLLHVLAGAQQGTYLFINDTTAAVDGTLDFLIQLSTVNNLTINTGTDLLFV